MTRVGFVYFVVFVAFVVTQGCASPDAPAVRALMQTPVAPASDAIFNAIVYTNGQLVSSPQSDEQWTRLRMHAESLRTAAAAMKALAPKQSAEVWLRQSDALAAAAAAAVASIDAKSLEGVLDAGGKIYDTCGACHAAYITNPWRGDPSRAETSRR